MSIIADTRWIGEHGIGRFARELLSRVPNNPIRCNGRPMQALDPLRLSFALTKTNPRDIFFSPGYNAPLFCRQPFVFSIHDLNHIDRDDGSSALKRQYYERVMRPACHRAEYVLTGSEYAKKRIVDWSSVDPLKVIIVGHGVNAGFSPDGTPHVAGTEYFLCVSNRRPHKNEKRLISAFARAAISPTCLLLMTGPPTDELMAHIARTGLSDRVRFCGKVSDVGLAELYRGAIAMLFPSLYEGFGLPVIESMACGTPVLTSTTTSLGELAAGAALLVNPEETDEIAEGITKLAADPALRASLSELGMARARPFTWDLVAARAQAAFRTIDPGNNASTSRS